MSREPGGRRLRASCQRVMGKKRGELRGEVGSAPVGGGREDFEVE